MKHLYTIESKGVKKSIHCGIVRLFIEALRLAFHSEDWRDWKKGEIAIVKKWNERPTALHNDSYTLEPTNGTVKDFHVLSDYMIEPLQ